MDQLFEIDRDKLNKLLDEEGYGPDSPLRHIPDSLFYTEKDWRILFPKRYAFKDYLKMELLVVITVCLILVLTGHVQR